MTSNAKALLTGALVILLLWGAWQIYAGWGLVTLDVREAPVSKVLASISRQGGIEIASNLDPDTPVTIKIRRVPPVEALDIVAVRAEAAWRLAYLGAPDRATINDALATFRAGQDTPEWTLYGGGGGFSFFEPESGQALDLRQVRWNPDEGGPLADVLQEAADSTGVLFAAPTSWEATVARPPSGRLAQAAPKLFREAGGVGREVFLLRASPSPEGEPPGRPRAGGWIGASSGPGNRGGWMQNPGDPERMARRVEAQIALLPAREQPRAREDFEQMRQTWQAVRDLPEDQRMARVQEVLSSPEMMERMAERREAREAKMTPEQRIQRSQRYWQRKMDARSSGRSR